MTSERDIEQLLDHWFTGQPTQVPDRALDGVADRIARQPQRPAWRLSWRDSHVNTYPKILLATAAIIVVAAAGFAILRPSGPIVGPPAPVPSPTVAPTPTPTPTPTPSPVARNGYGEVQGDPSRFTFTAPVGWDSGGWAFTNGRGFAGPTGIGVGASGAVNVPTNPCDGLGKVPPETTTVEDVIAALNARDDLVVSDPVDTTLGGLSGKRVQVELPADLSACSDLYVLFAEPDGSGVSAQGPSNVVDLWILEAQSGPIWVDIEHFPGTPAKDLAEAQALVNSIVFTP